MRGTGAVRVQRMEYLNAGEARDEVTRAGCVLGACSKEPVTHTRFGANTAERFTAKFRWGILSKQAFGKQQGFPCGSTGCQQQARRVLNPMCYSSVWLMAPQDGSGPCGAGGRGPVPAGCRAPQGLAVLSPAVTLHKKGGSPCSSPASDRPQLYLITN